MSLKRIEKELEKELDDVDAWIRERKKFFIKLLWVTGLIIAILVVCSLVA